MRTVREHKPYVRRYWGVVWTDDGGTTHLNSRHVARKEARATAQGMRGCQYLGVRVVRLEEREVTKP